MDQRVEVREPYTLHRRASAWAVHVFTASGAVFGLLALFAVFQDQPAMVFLWLAVALFVDGVDGTFARRADVANVLPGVDGSALDLVVDYFTYVVVPAVFMVRFGLLPDGFALALAGWVLLTSLYCFANTGMKSSDAYFVGFPAVWNVVALYLWLLDFGPWLNTAILLALGVLTFTRLKFLHPFRVRTLMPLNLAATAVWFVAGGWLVAVHPEQPPLALVPWLAASGYVVAMCAWRSLRDLRG